MKNNLPPFIEICRALTTAPSISATGETPNQSNAGLVTLLAGRFKDLGFNAEIQPVPDTQNKLNVLASIGQGAGGLLLTGHTGTVPFDSEHWARNPFTLTEHDSKLYGLGIAGIKGFFTFILDTLRDANVMKLKKPLYIPATANEETSMAGARYFFETTALCPDHATIGEPTSLQPVCAHKGHISNMIRILGQSGHSGGPVCGVSVIELMHDVIGRIMHLRNDLKARYHHDASTVPYPTLNLGHIHGGDAANRICVCCELHMDVRPLPGMTLNDLNGLFSEALAPASERWLDRLTIPELHPPIPGYGCPPDHQLVEVVEKLLGAQTKVVNYRTEAPFIQTLYPTLVPGPGSISQAYQSDEYLETRFIKSTRKLITQVVHHFCWH